MRRSSSLGADWPEGNQFSLRFTRMTDPTPNQLATFRFEAIEDRALQFDFTIAAKVKFLASAL